MAIRPHIMYAEIATHANWCESCRTKYIPELSTLISTDDAEMRNALKSVYITIRGAHAVIIDNVRYVPTSVMALTNSIITKHNNERINSNVR